MASPIIQATHVSKRFGDRLVLDDVSFTAEPGEIVALLGPNGAGKTTLISLLLGLRRPTSGSVKLFGGDPAAAQNRARVGAMLQEASMIDNLKVGEMIELFRSFYARPLPTAELLDAAGLVEQADQSATGLSGGQKQRLAFALALAGDPELLFLDEPTVGLDVEVRRRFWDKIREIADRATIILTTHYLEEADALSDRIVVLNEGKRVADAAPKHIKADLGGKWISFAYEGERPPLDVDRLPGASRVESAKGRIRVLSSASDEALKALLEHDVSDIEVRGADLEEAFLAMTKG